MRVLVIDDDDDLRSVVSRALQADGHVVTTALDLAQARVRVGDGVDLLVLDLRLPDGFGLELCRELRADGDTVPIVILTAHNEVAVRVAGLDAGADDFLAKPFAVAELRARVRALGRRGGVMRAVVHAFADVRLDFAARQATKAGAVVAITAKEWAIVEVLARADGRVVGRLDITESVWGSTDDDVANSLEVLIGRLRRKLGAGLIRTVRGEGYAIGGGP